MAEDPYLHKLDVRGIKPTAIRLLILRTMMDTNRALSQHDMEEILQTVDKSTIFRTITLFLEHHLIHEIDDGSGALKYAVCSDDCTCSVSEQHVHLYCENCHRAFCFRQQSVPVVEAPEGFVLLGVNYVLKGLCPACAAKAGES
ncbi:MAG: transcriptional repressor [Paraprevotella sp.]|nr:transcriptional repressor [Paraprevotella sp.]